MDVGDKLEDRIGIEIFEENKIDMIQNLFNDFYINRTQYELLNSWEQSYVLPKHLSSSLTSAFDRPVLKLYTRINHFKFVLDATDKIDIKGYFYYCF